MSADEYIELRPLSKREHDILQKMDAGAELTFSRGGGWWLELEQTSGRIPRILIMSRAIGCPDVGANTEYWSINDTGREMLRCGCLLEHKAIHKELKNRSNSERKP